MLGSLFAGMYGTGSDRSDSCSSAVTLRPREIALAAVLTPPEVPTVTDLAARRVVATPPVKAITCTLAVALMLAATRWGSYLGESPLFLTDVLILAALVDRAVGGAMFGRISRVRPGFRLGPPYLVLALLAYAGFRMLLSGSFALTVTWFRDGAPYLYVALALVSAHALARATPRSLELTMTWLWRALLFHLAWLCLLAVVGEQTSFSTPRPFLAGGIFYARPDIDSAVLGITAGLLVRRVLLGQGRARALVGLAAVGVAASGFTTRAGFIAVALCIAVAVGYSYVASQKMSLKRLAIAVLVPTAILGALVVLPSTTVGSRLVATIEPDKATAVAQQNAVGTTDARRKTWSGVIQWTTSSQTRTLFGTGMGEDFLAASGTLKYLEGTDYEGVRSPHDYFVGTFARLGLVGLGLLIGIVLQLLRQMIRFRRRIADEELLTFAALTVVGIIAVASFGVVLEAPFGAVPFWWAAGLLLALTRVGASDEAAQSEQDSSLPEGAGSASC